MVDDIPIFDFGAFLNGGAGEKERAARELTGVVAKYGFIYLRNHGISSDLVQKLFEINKGFFDKPLEYKMQVKKSLVTFCGYDAMLVERLNEERAGDLKESYMMRKQGSQWPHDWDEFREFLQLMHERIYSLALQILTSFAIGLGVDPNLFASYYENSEVALLRLLHYPPLPDRVEENQIRAGEHTDYGALTVLLQDSIGGLEVKTLSGEWIPAPYYENTVLINVGDVMEIWTNGLLRSTPHRVVNPSGDKRLKSRYSVAFFCDPDLECQISPLGSFVSEKNAPKYKPVLYKDYLANKYKATYDNNV